VSRNSDYTRKQAFESVMTFLSSSIRLHTTIERTGVAALPPNFNINDDETIYDYVYNAFMTNRNQNRIMVNYYCGLKDGKFAGVSYTGDLQRIELFSNYADVNNLIYYPLSDYDSRTVNNSAAYTVPLTDVTETSWLQKSLKVNDSTWTDSYFLMDYPDFLYITFVTPLFNKASKAYRGYCASDITTEGISKFIQYSDELPGTIAIIERSSGFIIGTSDPTIELFSVDGNNVVRATGHSDLGNTEMEQMIKFTSEKFGGNTFPQIKSGQFAYTKLRINGENQAINVADFTDGFGIEWIVVQAIPMSTFYSRFYNSIIVICCVTVGLLFLSIIVSVVAAQIFMRPINNLVSTADDIRTLQLEKVEQDLTQTKSSFTEVKRLQQSLYAMNTRLKQFKSFIPDHILSIIEAEVREGKQVKAAAATKDHHSSSASDKGSDKRSQSDTPSDSRGSSVSIHEGKTSVNNTLTSGLNSGIVTVMAVQFPDFDALLEHYAATDILEASKDLFAVLRNCVRVSNGQFVNISSDKSLVCWNSFIPQADHRGRACRTARSCLESVKKLHEQWTKNSLPLLNISIAICSGPVLFGNLGTDKFLFFSIIGKAPMRSEKMCYLNTEWGTRIVCSDDVFQSAKEDFHLRPITRLIDDKAIMVYELGEHKASDEWINEMDTQVVQLVNPWVVYQQAYDLYEKQQYDLAIEKFTEHLEKNPDDIVVQKLIAQCREEIIE
jgi:class 3 adenylate cyclase